MPRAHESQKTALKGRAQKCKSEPALPSDLGPPPSYHGFATLVQVVVVVEAKWETEGGKVVGGHLGRQI